MDFDQIDTFLAVIATGSFSQAARRLNTTQPNVSLRIAALERRLGCQLVDRSSRKACATPAGRAFLTYAERIASLTREARAAIADPATLAGVIRLGVSETIVHAWLPQLIRQVGLSFPGVDLEITVDTSVDMRDMLVARELDAALLMGPISEPHMLNRALCTYPLVWVAARKLALPRRCLGLADLAAHPILTYSRRTRPTMELMRKLKQQGLADARIYASASLATNIRLLEEGVGVGLLPAFLAGREVARGLLRRLSVTSQASLTPLSFTASYVATGSAGLIEGIVDLALACARPDDKCVL